MRDNSEQFASRNTPASSGEWDGKVDTTFMSPQPNMSTAEQEDTGEQPVWVTQSGVTPAANQATGLLKENL